MRHYIGLPYEAPPRGCLIDSTHPLGNGLVGWWPLHHDAVNRVRSTPLAASGFEWTGASGFAGKAGRPCVVFDATDSYFNGGDIYDCPDNGGFSVAIWFNTVSAANGSIIAKSVAMPAHGRWGLIFESSNVIALVSNADTGGGLTVSTSCSPYIDGRWHSLVLAIRRTTYFALYLDGKYIGENTNAQSASMDSTHPLYVGAYPDAGGSGPLAGFYWHGALADLRIYNRCLSPGEVRMLYERPFEMCMDPWPFRTYSIPATLGGVGNIFDSGIFRPVLVR